MLEMFERELKAADLVYLSMINKPTKDLQDIGYAFLYVEKYPDLENLNIGHIPDIDLYIESILLEPDVFEIAFSKYIEFLRKKVSIGDQAYIVKYLEIFDRIPVYIPGKVVNRFYDALANTFNPRDEVIEKFSLKDKFTTDQLNLYSEKLLKLSLKSSDFEEQALTLLLEVLDLTASEMITNFEIILLSYLDRLEWNFEKVNSSLILTMQALDTHFFEGFKTSRKAELKEKVCNFKEVDLLSAFDKLLE